MASDAAGKMAEQQAAAAQAAGAYASMAAAAKAALASVAGLGDGFDAATNRFRDASGRFVTAGSQTEAAFGRIGAAAQKYIVAGGAAVATAVKAIGAGFVALATSPIPSAAQAMTMFGAAAGSMIAGAGASVNAGLSSMADKLSKLGPEGAAAAAALQVVGASAEALTAVLGATIGTVSTLMGLAIEVTQRLDIMRDRFAGLAGSAKGGEAVQATVAKLAATLPFATAQVQAWAEALLVAGLQGNELEAALKAVAAAQALRGESGAEAAQKMLTRLAMGGAAATKLMHEIQTGGRRSAETLLAMGLNMRDVAAAAGMTEKQFQAAHLSAEQMQKAIEKALAQKGGGALADLGLTFEAIAQKAREGILSIFAKLGPSVKPFMQAIEKLFGQFNKGTPTIKALQKIATEVFGALFKYATLAVNAISGFVKANLGAKGIGSMWATVKSVWAGIVVVAKMMWAALMPAIAIFKAIWNNALLMNGIKTLFKAIGVAILVVVGILAIFVAVFAGIVGAVAGVASAVIGLFGSILQSALTLASGAASAASGFISGLLSGITGGAGAIISAVAGLAQGALGAFKSALGIASPSKVMMAMGGHMATGVAEGVEAGAPKAQAATAAMVDPKALRPGKANGAGGGKSVTFSGCTFGAVSETQIRAWVLKALDEDGTAGPEAAPA